jgi:iron complex transport system substrate-binding protein
MRYDAKMRRVLFIVLGLLIACPAAADAPRRVVSFNLCADQLVVALADPEQIAGLSPYAADPNLSVVADKARAFRRIDWQAEATIALSPDLVFVGSWDRSATRRMLRKLGYRTVELDLVPDFASARQQIAEVAAALGHPARGEQLIAALEAARARLDAVRLPYRTALVLERGGFTAGPDSLAATLLSAAGLQPPAGAPSGYGGFLSVEKLLVLRPDLVFLKDPPAQPSDQGALFFAHPALLALYPARRRIALPTRFTMCGGPALVAAFDYLADALARLAAND